MKQITFLRHSLVENPGNVIYGALPGFGLSAEGKETAAKRAKELAKYPYEAIFISPQQRAQETAEIIIKQQENKKTITDDRLREWVYISQGLPREVWHTKYKDLRAEYIADPYSIPTEIEGKKFESFQDLEQRVRDFIDEQLKSKQSLILAISHGDPIVMAIAATTGRRFSEVKQSDYPALCAARTLVFNGDKIGLQEYPAV